MSRKIHFPKSPHPHKHWAKSHSAFEKRVNSSGDIELHEIHQFRVGHIGDELLASVGEELLVRQPGLSAAFTSRSTRGAVPIAKRSATVRRSSSVIFDCLPLTDS